MISAISQQSQQKITTWLLLPYQDGLIMEADCHGRDIAFPKHLTVYVPYDWQATDISINCNVAHVDDIIICKEVQHFRC